MVQSKYKPISSFTNPSNSIAFSVGSGYFMLSLNLLLLYYATIHTVYGKTLIQGRNICGSLSYRECFVL